MRFPILTIVFFLGVFSTHSARADVPYGGDSLPGLYRKADCVVIVSQSRMIPSPNIKYPRVIRYQVQIKESVYTKKGVNAPVKTMILNVPAAFRLPKKALNDAYVFCNGPISKPAELRNSWMLVGGRSGVLPYEKYKGSMVTFLKSTKNANAKINWATEYVLSEDAFLQRSAVLQAGEFADKNQKAFDVLSEALSGARVDNSTKYITIQVLQGLNSEKAAKPLADLAQNKGAPIGLRREALMGLTSVPNGSELLKKWSTEGDSFLAPNSKTALDMHNRSRAKSVVPAKEMKKGLQELRRVIAKNDAKKISANLAAIQKVATFNTRQAATALAEVAGNSNVPMIVRTNAILGIARMEAGISLTVLQKLAGDPKQDEQIRILAKGLAGQ